MLTIPFIRIRTSISCYVLTALHYFTEFYCKGFYTALMYLLDKSLPYGCWKADSKPEKLQCPDVLVAKMDCKIRFFSNSLAKKIVISEKNGMGIIQN